MEGSHCAAMGGSPVYGESTWEWCTLDFCTVEHPSDVVYAGRKVGILTPYENGSPPQ